MNTYEVVYTDGTRQMVKAMSEEMARIFAMDNKWGPPSQNKTWRCSHWNGFGLSVKKIDEEVA